MANHGAAEGVAKVVEAEILAKARCFEGASVAILEGL